MIKEAAIFAAGCFWGIQYYFDQVPGVIESQVGYIGGKTKNPSYEQVCSGQTGHAEAVKIVFDPKTISYQTLLRHFFRVHNPTQMNRQGPDVGTQYRSAIFYLDSEQQNQAKQTIDSLNKEQFGGKVVTALEKASYFWPAAKYHQKFTERTGRGMCHVEYAPI